MWMRREGWRLRRASPARSRGVFRVVAVAVAVTATGATAGSAGAVGTTAGSAAAVHREAVNLALAYSCSFSSGSQPVTVRLIASFPATAATRQQVKPTGTGITITLPQAAVADLAGLHAAAVTLSAGLATQTTEATTAGTAIWPDFTSPAATVPATGPLTLTASGTAAPITVGAPGALTVAAAGLGLAFTGHTAAKRPARAPSLQVACVPQAGQDTTLARITVHGSGRPASSVVPADDPAKCLPFPKNLQLNPLFPLPKPLPGSNVFHQPQNACSYANGFTNAARLHEAVFLSPGLTDLHLGLSTFTKFVSQYDYFYQQVAGQLEYQGKPMLPPVRATLLGFGFMPVSATLQVSEIGSLNAALISCAPTKPKFQCPINPPNEALFFGRVTLRISNVAVNGQPLNVGSHCQTVTPFNLELVGLPPSYNISSIYGILTGTVTVPPFTGCANGPDNLDPIFDATVSGSGNFAKVNQAPFCAPTTSGAPGCPPVKPTPSH
jgi:hypothetical protein